MPGAISGISFGMKKGLNLGVPSPFVYVIISFWIVSNPPIPEPHITPTLSLLTLSSIIPESFIASSEQTSAY